jgi:hypothetical protein
MSKDNYVLFATLVLGLRPGKTHGTQRGNSSFFNMLLKILSPSPTLPLSLPSMSPQIDAHWRGFLPAFPFFFLGQMFSHLQSLRKCGARKKSFEPIWADPMEIWL